MDQTKERKDFHGGGGSGEGEGGRPTGPTLENNIRNVRAILDQARQAFGPETRRMVDGIVNKTEGTKQIENLPLDEKLPADGWCYVGLVQLTEIVNHLVVQQSSPATSTATAGAHTT